MPVYRVTVQYIEEKICDIRAENEEEAELFALDIASNSSGGDYYLNDCFVRFFADDEDKEIECDND